MRVSRVLLALSSFACAIAVAQGADPSADTASEPSSVTVNMGALPVPTPRFKPSPDQMHPLAQARPRPKPDPVALAVAASVPMTPIADESVPMPRFKPGSEVAVVETTPAVQQPAAPVAIQPEAPTPPPTVPVNLVTGPTTDKSLPYELTGVALDPNASRKPINPIEGFAVLSRVRFSKDKADVPAQAHATLDTLAQRLMSSRERVRLAAFSGKAGADTSQARRLSLARALAIRTYLVSKGVPVERVDVLAFGGATEGATDRVDVLVRGI